MSGSTIFSVTYPILASGIENTIIKMNTQKIIQPKENRQTIPVRLKQNTFLLS